ncbi:MAG: Hpt domain-containing protein [Candidatus Binataceae bacterium]
MSRGNSNSSRATSGATPETGEEKVTEQITEQITDDGPVSEGTVSRARIDRLRNSMPGKDALIDELIDLFVADLPRRLGAITQAIERADAPALALQAHALRGGAANFGAGRLDELCGKLEEIGVRGTLAEAAAMLDALERESARVRDALLALRSQHPATPPGARRGAQKSSGSSRKL